MILENFSDVTKLIAVNLMGRSNKIFDIPFFSSFVQWVKNLKYAKIS